MTAALGVHADDAADRAGGVAAVIASLPVSLRPDSTGAELVAIDGRPGWTIDARVAIDAGAKGLVVVDPVPEDATELDRVARAGGVPIVVDWPFAGNPAVRGATEYFHNTGGPHTLLECTINVGLDKDLRRVLMDQLTLVGALGHQVQTGQTVDRTERHYVVAGRTNDHHRVRLTGIATNALPATASARLLGADGCVELTVPTPETARPGRVTVTSSTGTQLLPTLFETAHRLSWRRLVLLVHDGEQADDLTTFIHDSSIALTLTEPFPGR